VRIFLTGATGYIGSAVADKLMNAGHEVLGLARSIQSTGILKSRNILPLRGDLSDSKSLIEGARSADAVVHAAFTLKADVEASVAAEHSAVSALLEGVRGTSKPFIFTSGTAVLGDTGPHVYEEDTPIAPHPFRGRLKTEALVLHAKDVHGIVLRPPNVYGDGDGHGILTVLRQAGRTLGAVPYANGAGQHLWSFVHVEDLAELFVLAVTKAQRGERFHAGAQSGLETRAIAAAVSHGLGFAGQTQKLSLDELRHLFPVPALADYWSSNSQSSSDKAKRLLGWQPEHSDMLAYLAKQSLPANR